MFLNNNNNVNNDNNRDLSKYKLPLIIGGIIAFVVIIIFLVSKLLGGNNMAFDDGLYYITLVGDANITLYQGDTYQEPGYKGTDDNGRDLTNKVVVSNNINNTQIGNYKVTYTLGSATKERLVKVIERPVGATYIYLYGDVNVFLYVGETYKEPGYEVVDSVDGARLKDLVKVSSDVDTSKEGIYKVIYTVTNTSGVTTSKERTVIVMDRSLSLIPNTTEMTNGNVTINIYARDELFSYLILPNNIKVEKSISTYQVSSNGTYKFIMYNKNGEAKEKSIEITNIDRETPSGSCSGYYQNDSSYISVSAKDNVGISHYMINGVSYTSNNITVNSEMATANVTIYDKAGNSKNISCSLTNRNTVKPASSSSSSSINPASSSSVKPSSSSSKPSSSSPSSSKPSSSQNNTELSTGNVNNISPNYPSISKTKNVSVNYYQASNGKGFSYWLYLPDKVVKNLPIIIFLHGINQRGNDYVKGTTKAIPQGPINEVLKHGYSYNAIVINPQADTYGAHHDNISEYTELINKIANEFQANKKKISIMGFSHGCVGTMEWMYNNKGKDLFSAIVVVGCDPYYRTSDYINVPVWALVGANTIGDRNLPRLSTFIDDVKKAGGNAKFTRITDHPVHNILADDYSILRDNSLNVVDWMLSFSK